MTTRSTAVGLLSLLGGVLVLVVSDGPARGGGVALLLTGLLIATMAGLRGIHDSPEASLRAAAAAERRDTDVSAHMQRASETGRWPRVIGGG